jgi:regulator of protease activity HflC (stomatin/prohibitin superfamily)
MKSKLLIALCAAATLLIGCGKRVEVPIAHVGKVKTAAGMSSDIKYPSSFRLPPSMSSKNELVLLEVSHFAVKEEVQLFIPKDQLNMTFDVRATLFIDPERSDDLFEKLPARQTSEDRVLLIQAENVYETYGQQILRTQVRTILSRYSIDEIMSQRDKISDELDTSIRAVFTSKKYPVGVIQFGLADIQYPAVIIKAQELAKEREVAIATAESQKQIQLKEAEARLEVARKEQEIDLVEAETQVLVEQKINEAVSPAFVTQRALKVLDALAASPNKTFVLPMDVFKRPDMLTGLYGEVFRAADKPAATRPSSAEIAAP